jgi:ADP-ribose pyrophosphatase YjhB (NUDIX family)
MKYCSNCGARVSQGMPDGDTHLRHICITCQTIHYQNPKIVTGCIPEWEDRILLCRRAIEPQYGMWTLPAGFMENGETAVQAAARETREEANAQVEVGSLFSLYSLPHIDQVYLIFRSRLLSAAHSPGIESLETRLVQEAEIPWDDMAFPVIRETLRHYFADRRSGNFGLHQGDITERMRKPSQG